MARRPAVLLTPPSYTSNSALFVVFAPPNRNASPSLSITSVYPEPRRALFCENTGGVTPSRSTKPVLTGHVPVTPVESTLTNLYQNKGLTVPVSPLDATLTKNKGGGVNQEHQTVIPSGAGRRFFFPPRSCLPRMFCRGEVVGLRREESALAFSVFAPRVRYVPSAVNNRCHPNRRSSARNIPSGIHRKYHSRTYRYFT